MSTTERRRRVEERIEELTDALAKVDAPPRPDVTTIIDRLREQPTEPRKRCHTLRADGSALCGAWGPPPGGKDDVENVHSSAVCRAERHPHCILCTELSRQLGDDGLIRG